jgi:hypothetical protein
MISSELARPLGEKATVYYRGISLGLKDFEMPTIFILADQARPD